MTYIREIDFAVGRNDFSVLCTLPGFDSGRFGVASNSVEKHGADKDAKPAEDPYTSIFLPEGQLDAHFFHVVQTQLYGGVYLGDPSKVVVLKDVVQETLHPILVDKHAGCLNEFSILFGTLQFLHKVRQNDRCGIVRENVFFGVQGLYHVFLLGAVAIKRQHGGQA